MVHLGDVLFGKSDKLMKQQGLEGDIVEEGKSTERKGMYLVTMENNGVSKTGFDNKKLQRVINSTIRVQRRMLNIIFHPTLVNFSTAFDR